MTAALRHRTSAGAVESCPGWTRMRHAARASIVLGLARPAAARYAIVSGKMSDGYQADFRRRTPASSAWLQVYRFQQMEGDDAVRRAENARHSWSPSRCGTRLHRSRRVLNHSSTPWQKRALYLARRIIAFGEGARGGSNSRQGSPPPL